MKMCPMQITNELHVTLCKMGLIIKLIWVNCAVENIFLDMSDGVIQHYNVNGEKKKQMQAETCHRLASSDCAGKCGKTINKLWP